MSGELLIWPDRDWFPMLAVAGEFSPRDCFRRRAMAQCGESLSVSHGPTHLCAMVQ
jgi:hypothetical protein